MAPRSGPEKRGPRRSGQTRNPHALPPGTSFGRRWSWVQFVFGFIIGGALAFLNIDPDLDAFWAHATKTLIIASLCGLLAGGLGDAAWHGIFRLLRRM